MSPELIEALSRAIAITRTMREPLTLEPDGDGWSVWLGDTDGLVEGDWIPSGHGSTLLAALQELLDDEEDRR